MEKVMRIDGVREGVPLGVRPLTWDRRMPVSANVNVLADYVRRYTELLPVGCYIDEAAIMVPRGQFYVEQLLMGLESQGWDHFNSARDLVFANPFGTRYVVEYNFLRHPRYSWRLEVMQMSKAEDGNTGFSPLHQALWPNGQEPTWHDHADFPIPHLSFKPPTDLVEAVGARKAVRQCIDSVATRGAIIAQACQSTYGEFWYMLPVDALRQLYLKPRINLRDAAGVGA